MEFENGAVGTVRGDPLRPRPEEPNTFEINGEKGTIVFDLERMNDLEVYLNDTRPRTPTASGTCSVSEAFHPYWEHRWPQGHMIGWEDTFVHELAHFLTAVEGKDVAPYGATFEDGYKIAEICDAIVRAHETGQRQRIEYRSL